MEKAVFSVYRKGNGVNDIYYYSVFDADGIKHDYSTGCTDEGDAYRYCLALMAGGELKSFCQGATTPTLEDYTKKWFDYEKCPYIRGKINRGFKYSHSFADLQRGVLKNYILPTLGKIKISHIQVVHIETWLETLKEKGLSTQTINHYLKTLRVILKEAERLGDIKENPAKRVLPYKPSNKEKGILDDKEVKLLFRTSGCWKDDTHKIINLLASQTGMRMGEIQALKKKHIHPDHIKVCHSWDRKYGIKETKSGTDRIVPITEEIFKLLEDISKFEDGESFIFSTDGKNPLCNTTIKKWFYKALVIIGIDEIERKKRNITFHSWRHYFNTKLRTSGIPDTIVRSIIGHSDISMSERYTHLKVSDFNEVKKLQKKF